MFRLFIIPAALAIAAFSTSADAGAPAEKTAARPAIWVTPSEKPLIQKKIAENDWARGLYNSLKSRADEAAPDSLAERRARLLDMPLIWPEGGKGAPVLGPYKRAEGPADPALERSLKWGYPVEPQQKMLKGLQDAVDCGVLYYLTSEERYAICAADILHLFVEALNNGAPPNADSFNGGWLYPNDHLLEVRLIAPQLPIIYDLVHGYLADGGKVYDAETNKLQPFNMKEAQHVFRTYANLVLNRGLYDSNWPLLEMASLVHNTLALEDPVELAALLQHVIEKDTERQPSLKTVYQTFSKLGEVWPESLNYSTHVSTYFIYNMTLLDKRFPDLKLGQKYPNVLAVNETYYNLQFPNGDYPAFGDSNRTMKPDYLTYEVAVGLAQLNGNDAIENKMKGILQSSIAAGLYKRSSLFPRNYAPTSYRLPLQLLWSVSSLEGAQTIDLNPPRPRSVYLPFAGVAVQRNTKTPSPQNDGLMAVMGGAAYIHGHASGIDLELYGQGEVLGVESGKSSYSSDIHENYYRLFAAHNTVISNGASGASGQWAGLGMDTARITAVEPALGAEGVSEHHSFTTMGFQDKFNLVAPADHERTVALIRLTEKHGYYLDIFRAKSDVKEQFHDYVYHNIGDVMTFSSKGADLGFSADPSRYVASASLPWSRNKEARHPGWHFFEDVATAGLSENPVTVEFIANDLGKAPVRMRAHIPAGMPLEVTRVKAPTPSTATAPYNNRPIPAFLLRRKGEAWSNPFVAVFESDQGGSAVQSVERLMSGEQFKGVRVTSEVDGRKVVQYVVSQEPGQTFALPKSKLKFVGRFGVLTLSADGRVTDAYIGDGQSWSYEDFVLKAAAGETAAFWKAD